MKREPWRVLIVDDHPGFRESVRFVLAEDPQFDVVAEAVSGEEAIVLVQQHQPTLVLMDLRMPGINGLIAATTIKSVQPGIIIIMLSSDWSEAHERRARAIGIHARIAKQQFNLIEIHRWLT
ncbi:MAG: response regulator transcription factor [Anaerolineae bacterium]|nr:response regulator transcription factor [Anaerolineae bacterium]